MTIKEEKNKRHDIFHALSNIIKDRTVIVGVGNILRGDDAFGPVLIEQIKDNINAVCIDAGSAPENYLGKIIKEKPDNVLIVDAAHMGLAPGEYMLLKKDDIIRSGFTTHDLSPVMFIEYLEKETGADISMLGIQPEKMDFGEEMSKNVKKTLEEIKNIFIQTDKKG
ncbi:MAG: hydrogenase maturation peptidase HycI [Candidatus Omnitrophota bacterium]